MADVIATFRVMPKSVNVDLDKLETKIKKLIKPEGITRDPIAFGLVALNITKLIPDAGGELEKIENKLKSIQEVGGVKVTELTRAL